MISLERTHSVGFKGGIACIKISPTEDMLMLESQADSLRRQATLFSNQSYEIGQKIAEDIFRKKHPTY